MSLFLFIFEILQCIQYIHSITFIQYIHLSPFNEVPLHLPGVPSRAFINSCNSWSKVSLYHSIEQNWGQMGRKLKKRLMKRWREEKREVDIIIHADDYTPPPSPSPPPGGDIWHVGGAPEAQVHASLSECHMEMRVFAHASRAFLLNMHGLQGRLSPCMSVMPCTDKKEAKFSS